jgi:hypothetical protein
VKIYDKEKSDLYSLGVVALEMSLMQSVNDIYIKDEMKIDLNRV